MRQEDVKKLIWTGDSGPDEVTTIDNAPHWGIGIMSH
jgi:hypothetical protein